LFTIHAFLIVGNPLADPSSRNRPQRPGPERALAPGRFVSEHASDSFVDELEQLTSSQP
jgi:hypothetical protein